MTLPTVRFNTLARMPVTISGAWHTPIHLYVTPRSDWFGKAMADEPLVALALVSDGNLVQWAKSERGTQGGLDVNLTLFPLHWNVQVNFSVGGGYRRGWSLTRRAFDTLPTLLESATVSTGEILAFGTVEGHPVLELGILFIARRDVRVGRKGLWRVRQELLDPVLPPFDRILARRRCGNESALDF